MLTLNSGQSQELFSNGPISVDAACSNDGLGGSHQVAITATTTEDGTWPSFSSNQPLPVGSPTTVRLVDAPQPYFGAGFGGDSTLDPFSIVAPSGGGVALNVGPAALGIDVLGADCAVVMYAVG